jgi:branched-chain amino acid transport system permease protein
MKTEYKVIQSSNASKFSSMIALLIIICLFLAPWWAGRADIRLMSEIFLYLSLASLWNLLAGYCGLVSVGQQAFVGFGGYLLFALTIFSGLNPLIAIPITGLFGALISFPIAFLIFRLRGAYFAIGTWVVAEVFRLSFAQIQSLGGGSGSSLPVAIVKSIASSKAMRESLIYWMILSLTVFILLSVYFILRSRRGIALIAIRDNELASESLGINIIKSKLFVYIVTSGLTTVIGALIFLQKLRISPDAAFNVNDWTAFVIFIVVIGGIGTIEGPIIGVLVFFVLRETLSDLGSIYLIMLGFVAIFVMIKAPKGIWGYISNTLKIELFPLSRKLTKFKGE